MPTSVQSMEEIFKIPRVIDGHLVVDERDVYAVFEVKSKLNPLTADSRDLNSALRRFTNALDGLRSGERVQVVVDCRRYNPGPDIRLMNAKISDAAADGFRSFYPLVLESYLENYCRLSLVPVLRYYLLFTYQPVHSKIEGAEETPLVQKGAEVDRRARDFVTALTDTNVSAVALDEAAIVDLLDEALNPSRLAPLPPEALAEAPAEPGLSPSRAELLLRSPLGHPRPRPGRRFDHLQVGRRLVRTMGFLRVPDQNVQKAISDLLLLAQTEFRLSFHVEGLSQDRTKAEIQKKRSAAAGAVMIGGGKNTQGSEEQATEYDQLIRRAERRELRFCRWAGYLTLFGDEEAPLQVKCAEVMSSFSGMVPDEGIYRQVEYWQSALPLGADVAKNSLWAETATIGGLYPFFNFNSSSPEGGILLGFSPANQPVFYHPWSSVVLNGNVFVTGQAGSGKSFAICNILNRLAPEAYDVSVIDKAKSYKFSCLAQGGDYIEWDLDGRYAVNVWDVLDYDSKLVIDGQDYNDLDKAGHVGPAKVESVLGLAEIFMAEVGQSMPKVERSLLLEGIQETYARALKVSDGKVDPATVPTFTDLAETLKAVIDKTPKDQFTPARRDLLQKLKPAIDGPLAGLVNKRTTLDIHGRVRVFDISNLPERDEIQGVVMYILTSWLMSHWRRNKALNIRQVAVLDELYFFMLFASGRRLLDNLARRSRHLGLMCFFATQQLDDVLLHPETPAILRNSDTKILFRQDRSVIDKLAALLSLTDQEKDQLESLRQVRGQYSNAFLIYGSMRNILTVRPDPVSRWLNTTEPTYDVPRRSKALEAAGGDPWAAVQLLLDQEA
jgi:type IV secretory pathway VirB4 component